MLKLSISRKMVIKIDSASGALGQDLRRSISAEIRFLDLMGVAKVPALPPPWQLWIDQHFPPKKNKRQNVPNVCPEIWIPFSPFFHGKSFKRGQKCCSTPQAQVPEQSLQLSTSARRFSWPDSLLNVWQRICKNAVLVLGFRSCLPPECPP